jgi:hypothetical protein
MRYSVRMARPATLQGATRRAISISSDLAKAIEDYRFANRVKTEAEAIRRLIELGLKAAVDRDRGTNREMADLTTAKPAEAFAECGFDKRLIRALIADGGYTHPRQLLSLSRRELNSLINVGPKGRAAIEMYRERVTGGWTHP